MMPRKFKEKIETRLCLDVQGEYDQSKANRQQDFDDFENYVDLLDQKRTEKEYQWLSDIKIPEYVSQELTQASLDAAMTFGTRDFAEVYLEDASDEAKACAEAAKTLINKTLNRRDLFYYQKRIRAGSLARLSGLVHAECRWNKQQREIVVAHELVESDVDIHGDPVTDREKQLPALKTQPVTQKTVDKDQFEIDILDNRNVFYDDSYTYSLQHKPFVIIRCEKSLERLKREKDQAGYFNLDILEEVKPPMQTETNQDTYNKYRNDAPMEKPVLHMFDILKRYGPSWVIVKKRNPETGLPIEVEPGFDDEGKMKDKAELAELIQEYALADGKMTLIAYHPTPYIDCLNQPYRPLLRGICYLHPTEDGGFGDAKHAHDLQIGLDDTINMSNDRTKLATIPLFKVKKMAYEENSDQFYVEPGHNIPLTDMEDLQEFKIQDNIQGAMQQASFFTDKMQQLTATYPTTMGRLPVQASTTATAVQGSEQKTDNRQHFKALTWTNTWDADLYWMIQQMTWRFAEPQTGFVLMREKVYKFRPDLDYFYLPVTQAIESEQSKQMKLRSNTTFMQMLQPYMQMFANQPGFIMFLSDILLDTAELMGKDVERYAGKLLNPAIPPIQQGGQGQGGGGAQAVPQGGGAPSNQMGIPQGAMQSETRQAAGGGYY
jgi:hypothetical protein